MTPPSDTRKLSAVMFADIEGYTRKFQQDEPAALALADRHRKDLNDVVPRHGGKLIQTYGDGSVTVYESVVNAVEAGIALQAASHVHGVPLRIGIHLGDLLFRDNDVFGDAVNIASRIQSAGVAGSILISDRVALELRNHPDIKLHALGFFTLKNVIKPMPLYAVEGAGLVIPPHASPLRSGALALVSKWPWIVAAGLIAASTYTVVMQRKAGQVDWSKERVTVARFSYDSTDAALDSLADILFVALTQELNLSAPPDVQSLSATMFLTGGDETKLADPDFVLKSGCRFSLRGTIEAYGLRGDSIMITSTVFDCRLRKEVMPGLRPVYFPRKDMHAGISAMLDVAKGYIFSRDTLPVSAPTHAAYIDYLKALRHWGRAPGEFETSKQYLLSAIGKDSSFFEAYTLLLDLFSNERNCLAASDTMNWVRERFPNPTDIQSSYIQFHLLDIDGERARAWQAFAPILARKPTDLHLATDAIVMALQYLNDPDMAISAMKRIADPKDVLQDCPYCETYMINGIRAFTEKGQAAKAAPWVDIVRPHVNTDSEFAILSSFYLANGQPESVDQLIADLVRKSTDQANRLDNLSYYHYSAYCVANRLGATAEAQRHLDLSLTYSRQLGHEGRIGRCMLLNGDARGAITAYMRYMDTIDSSKLKSPVTTMFMAELGIAYAQAGAIKNANEIIRLLEADTPGPCDYGLQDYYVARILAHLGETERSLAYLKQSLMKGMKFTIPAYFQYDPFLILLKENKPYQALLRSRQ